jgi:hypothetical protein
MILFLTALFFSGLAVKMMPAFVGNSMCVSCTVRLILFDFVVLLTFGDEYLYRTHYGAQQQAYVISFSLELDMVAKTNNCGFIYHI